MLRQLIIDCDNVDTFHWYYEFLFSQFTIVQPWETYTADLTIDLHKHHVPKTFLDKVAFRTVKLLRIPTDVFFKVSCLDYIHFILLVSYVPEMPGV